MIVETVSESHRFTRVRCDHRWHDDHDAREAADSALST